MSAQLLDYNVMRKAALHSLLAYVSKAPSFPQCVIMCLTTDYCASQLTLLKNMAFLMIFFFLISVPAREKSGIVSLGGVMKN